VNDVVKSQVTVIYQYLINSILYIVLQILLRYDIVLVQEIRDIQETAFPKLVDEVNRYIFVFFQLYFTKFTFIRYLMQLNTPLI